MARADYSKSLFSLNGAEPCFLPEKFQILNGEYRRSISVDLTDIQALNYYGPIQRPAHSATETLDWDGNTYTYSVRSFTAEELDDQGDKYVRASLEQILSDSDEIYQNPELTPEGIAAYETYYGSITYVLNRANYSITDDDIPTLSLPWNATYSGTLAGIVGEVSENYNTWKLIYENIARDESLYSARSSGYFQVPSGWVLGSGMGKVFDMCPSGVCMTAPHIDVYTLPVNPVTYTIP